MNAVEESVPSPQSSPHEIIGHFIVVCAVLDYRLSQLISSWFAQESRLKFLSNAIHSIEPSRKNDIIRDHLSVRHPAGPEIVALIDKAEAVLNRRDLAVQGVLTKLPDGGYTMKNLAAHRGLVSDGETDQLLVSEISEWARQALALASEAIHLSKLPTTAARSSRREQA